MASNPCLCGHPMLNHLTPGMECPREGCDCSAYREMTIDTAAARIIELGSKLSECEIQRAGWEARYGMMQKERDETVLRLGAETKRADDAEVKFELACKTLGGEMERYRIGRNEALELLEGARQDKISLSSRLHDALERDRKGDEIIHELTLERDRLAGRLDVYRKALQDIVDVTPANGHKTWPHHHHYLFVARTALESAAVETPLPNGG